jgi:hypothetical protein
VGGNSLLKNGIILETKGQKCWFSFRMAPRGRLQFPLGLRHLEMKALSIV